MQSDGNSGSKAGPQLQRIGHDGQPTGAARPQGHRHGAGQRAGNNNRLSVRLQIREGVRGLFLNSSIRSHVPQPRGNTPNLPFLDVQKYNLVYAKLQHAGSATQRLQAVNKRKDRCSWVPGVG